MKRILLSLAVAVAAVVLSGCASTTHSRIEKFPEAYAALPPEHKSLVLQQRVAEGMTRDGVFFSWGPPARVAQGSRAGTAIEHWEYVDYQPVHSTRIGVGFGFGYGRYGSSGRYGYYPPGYGYGAFDYGPEIVYVPREAARVDFQNGVVTGWTRKF
ncbi:hypothetical protein BH23VER1_BH23VER1_20460 [soil metagenome]